MIMEQYMLGAYVGGLLGGSCDGEVLDKGDPTCPVCVILPLDGRTANNLKKLHW